MVPGTGDLASHEREARVTSNGPQSVYVKDEIVRAKVVVSGVGGLVEPKQWPQDISGFESFEGEIMHTARWDDSVDLKNKDVIMVGSGCSAAQVVPEIVKDVRSVTQIMRTPPWVQPDLLTPEALARYEEVMPKLATYIPGLALFVRCQMFWKCEKNFLDVFTETTKSRRLRRPRLEKKFLDHMRRVAPEKYHEILTPNYSFGCKRRIVGGAWYRSLHAPNVELTTQPLTRVHAKSVTIGPGHLYPPNSTTSLTDEVREIPADVIILANGFSTNVWLHPLRVIGRGNKNLWDLWDERGGAQAYQGIVMDHCPNFFMLFGPNMGTGHTSVIFATENAVNYSLQFIKPILNGEVSSYEIKEEAERAWTQKLQAQLQKTVFRKGNCSSWYITADGWNSSTYPYVSLTLLSHLKLHLTAPPDILKSTTGGAANSPTGVTGMKSSQRRERSCRQYAVLSELSLSLPCLWDLCGFDGTHRDESSSCRRCWRARSGHCRRCRSFGEHVDSVI